MKLCVVVILLCVLIAVQCRPQVSKSVCKEGPTAVDCLISCPDGPNGQESIVCWDAHIVVIPDRGETSVQRESKAEYRNIRRTEDT
ncbi:hypothetical protein B566_EDAN001843 [Ephemera danica]|nr:hypothetical protein B566_EDAN001843 [Ephemera danica]